ncbi:hypothetical protein PL373_18935 [Tenacibaculum maritimum]|nr:hypothetical protein [Tenacibaculum maritimum]MDB0603164.1 hypothetical protein [Tenacibaculum maritimum]MDB0610427.1 hypothetical protein [Tenacibaculum maritimum]
MRKQISYKSNVAVIEIELNAFTERHPNGISYHKAKVNGFNNGFQKEYKIHVEKNLEDSVMQIEADFIEWVDMPPQTKEEKVLADLGYIK